MKYLVGLLVFSCIGSFLISDTIDFGRALRKSNSFSHLYLDFFRLLVLGGMASIGYMLARETFQKDNDWIVFLIIGTIGALAIQIVGGRGFAATRGDHRP